MLNKEEIKQNADIVRVVENYLPIKQKSRGNFFACCPFHAEKTPSFSVNADKQMFHCFGCGATGDVFEFVSKIDGLEFRDAVFRVAEICGLSVVDDDTNAAKYEISKKAALDFYEKVNNFFALNLRQNRAAPDYLDSRNLTAADFEKFGVGFCPDIYAVTAFLKENNLMKIAAAVKFVSDKGACIFHDRVTFALKNNAGAIVGFSGRKLPGADENLPKYLNSADSFVFHKKQTLYNYAAARKSILENKTAIICEGFFDCIALRKFGIENCVATCGTALTREHLAALNKIDRDLKYVFAFDRDAAGFAASQRAFLTAVENQLYFCDVGVLNFRDLKDCGDLLQKYRGIKNLPKFEPSDVFALYNGFEFYVRRALKLCKNTKEKSSTLNDLKAILNSCDDELFRREWAEILNRYFSVSLSYELPKIENNDLTLKIVKYMLRCNRAQAKVQIYDRVDFLRDFEGLNGYFENGEMSPNLAAIICDEKINIDYSIPQMNDYIKIAECRWLEKEIRAAAREKNIDKIINLQNRMRMFRI